MNRFHRVVNPPDDPVHVTPKRDGLNCTYSYVNGRDVISIVIDDARLGAIVVALTTAYSHILAENLVDLLEDVDIMRQRWIECENRENGE